MITSVNVFAGIRSASTRDDAVTFAVEPPPDSNDISPNTSPLASWVTGVGSPPRVTSTRPETIT